jgi:LysR family hydrogen peroxide-inducible transcriptional activator
MAHLSKGETGLELQTNKRFTHAAGLSLKQLSYLLAVSETLNFTRAADLCCVTQSTLSSGLAELERLLGVLLVERDRQRVSLTPIGLDIVQRARDLLAASEDLLNLAQQACAPDGGPLHVGIIPTIAPFLLGKMLNNCQVRFPKLQMFVRESQTRTLLEQVNNGGLDAAVVALPIPLGKLEAHELFQEELRLVVHQSDDLMQNQSVSMDHLDPSRLLLLEEGHCLRDHTLSACPTRAGSQEHHPIESTNLSTMVQLVHAGMGYALLPNMAIQAGILAGTDVKTMDLGTEPKPTRTIALVTRASHPRREFLLHQLSMCFIAD